MEGFYHDYFNSQQIYFISKKYFKKIVDIDYFCSL